MGQILSQFSQLEKIEYLVYQDSLLQSSPDGSFVFWKNQNCSTHPGYYMPPISPLVANTSLYIPHLKIFPLSKLKKGIINAGSMPLQILSTLRSHIGDLWDSMQLYNHNALYKQPTGNFLFQKYDYALATQILFDCPRPPYMVDYYTASRVLFPTSLPTQA